MELSRSNGCIGSGPDLVAYTAAISCCERRWQQALRLLKAAQGRGPGHGPAAPLRYWGNQVWRRSNARMCQKGEVEKWFLVGFL